MTSPAMRERLVNGAIIGSTTAAVFILSLVLLTLVFGNQQQRTLNDIKGSTRAQVCVLILPTDPIKGRSENDVNSRCLIPNGIAPVDANGDGRIEFQP